MNPATRVSLTRICRVIIYVLCTVAVLLSFYLTDPEVSGPGHGFVRLIIITILPFFILERLLNFRETGLHIPWSVLILLIFALGAVFSGLRAGTPWQGLELMQWFLIAFLFLLVIANLAHDRVFFWLMLSAVLAGGISLAVFGIDQQAYQFDRMIEKVEAQKAELLEGKSEGMQRAYMARVHSREVFATFMHPNAYGACMGAVVLLWTGLTLALLRQAGANRGAVILFAIFGLVPMAGMLLSSSKGAWGAVAAAGVFLFCLRAPLRRRWKALAAGGFIILVLIAALATSLLDASIKVRQGYWRAGWQVIQEAPLTGIRPGKFAHHYTRHKGPRDTEVQNPHNIYLRFWAELGLPLALIFLAGWIGFFLTRPVTRPEEEDYKSSPLSAAYAAVFLFVLPLLGFIFQVWRECSGGGALLMALSLVGGGVIFLLMRRLDPRQLPFLTGACRAVVFLFLLHSMIDFDLAIPGIMVMTVVCAGLVMGHRPGFHLKGAAVPAILLIGLVLWPFLYLKAGLRTFECRMQVAEINHLLEQKPVEWAKIRDLAQKGRQVFPDMGLFISFEAESYGKTGQIHEMVKARLELAELLGNNASVWSHLGRSEDRLGRYEIAASHHQKAIEYYPVNPRYYMFYAQNRSAEGNRDEARQLAARALDINARIIDRNVKLSEKEIMELKKLID